MTGSSIRQDCSATGWSPWPPATDPEPRHSRHNVASKKVHQTYAEVIDDPEVEVVYNALVNSLHAQWNEYALNAGKHVLSEKPFARNAAEASLVRNVARTAPGQIVEGFHYLHHPVNQRLRELVTSGELGDVQPRPPSRSPTSTLPCESSSPTQMGSRGSCIGT